jgi:DNA-directed RNA polymerase subunit RPC12/RpoP
MMPRQAENLVGMQFGTRKVIGRGEPRDYAGYKTLYWKTVCVVCGHETEVQGSSLKRGVGCQKCRHGAPPKVQQRRAAKPVPEPAKLAKHRPMAVGQLMSLLSELPYKAQIRVHLVGRDGHATRMLKDVSAVGKYVLLVAELPEKIEPWR